MTRAHSIDIPGPATTPFTDGIVHPDLLLWDSWTYEYEGTLALFCLAVARRDRRGRLVTAANRDDYPFHVRRFTSPDGGRTWHDEGAYLHPSQDAASTASHNVWSGSALVHDGKLLFGFTGVRAPSPDRRFVQSICLLETEPGGSSSSVGDAVVLSDAERDYDAIRRAGYYVAPPDAVGRDEGEEGGPILAWRDPFLISEGDGCLRAYWSAKVAPTRPAVAHGRLRRDAGGWVLEDLLPPITLPDASDYTQAEVPKVYADPSGGFLMLLSTCDRVHEGQPDDGVSKELRLFRSASLDGPWAPYSPDGSVLPGVRHLFGGSFTEVADDRAILLAPYTEMAAPERRLTFAPLRTVDLIRTNKA